MVSQMMAAAPVPMAAPPMAAAAAAAAAATAPAAHAQAYVHCLAISICPYVQDRFLIFRARLAARARTRTQFS